MSESNRNKNILIAEDEKLSAEVVQELLLANFPEARVHLAADGIDALAVLDHQEIDLLITDLCMPRLDGLGLLSQLEERKMAMPAIVMTAFGRSDIEASARHLGGSFFFEKPIDLDLLIAAVSHLLFPKQEPQSDLERKVAVFMAANQQDPDKDTQPVHLLTRDVVLSWGTSENDSEKANPKEKTMADVKESLNAAMSIDGALGVALVDFNSGMSLGYQGGGPQLNLEVAAAGNTAVVRAKMKVMKDLGLKDAIEDILITLGRQYHIIRPLQKSPNLFLYLATDRDRSNLAMARHKLNEIEENLRV